MEFNIFDVIIISITLILAIKGFFNGIIKEISGLVGIALGIYLGSSYYESAGKFINSSIFKIPNESAVNVVGFVAVFILTWLFIIILGLIFSKIIKIAQLGLIDRLGGVIFAAGKFFIIVAVIVTMLSKIDAMHNQMKKWSKNSVTYSYIIKTGEFLINIKPEEVKQRVSSIKEKIDKKVGKDIVKKVEETTKKISETIEKNFTTNKGE